MKSTLLKSAILLLISILLWAGCQKQSSNRSVELLGVLGLLQSSSSSCKNDSGLVICIPPGFRF